MPRIAVPCGSQRPAPRAGRRALTQRARRGSGATVSRPCGRPPGDRLWYSGRLKEAGEAHPCERSSTDLFAERPYCEMPSLLDAAFPAGPRYRWRSTFLERLPAEAMSAIADAAASRPSPLTAIMLEHYGDAPRSGAGGRLRLPAPRARVQRRHLRPVGRRCGRRRRRGLAPARARRRPAVRQRPRVRERPRPRREPCGAAPPASPRRDPRRAPPAGTT